MLVASFAEVLSQLSEKYSIHVSASSLGEGGFIYNSISAYASYLSSRCPSHQGHYHLALKPHTTKDCH